MSQSSNKTMIGLFVLGGAALLVAALAAFSSGKLFTKQYQCIMYFESSVSGLNVGSPVLFRGVPIGEVKEIEIKANPSQLKFSIPVVAELTGGRIKFEGIGVNDKGENLASLRKESPQELIKTLSEKGLRAQLVTQSFVTGQLAIALDLRPNTPMNLRGDGKIIEIPTIPSEFDALAHKIKSLPLSELVASLAGAAQGIEKLVNSPEVLALPGKLDNSLTTATQLMADIKAKLDDVGRNLDQTLKSYTDLAGNLDQRAGTLTADTRKSLQSLDAAVIEGKTALNKFQKVMSPESPTVMELNKALAEIAQVARSIRGLSDYLERHPEALIQGKGNSRR